jgi:Methyltransferase domain
MFRIPAWCFLFIFVFAFVAMYREQMSIIACTGLQQQNIDRSDKASLSLPSSSSSSSTSSAYDLAQYESFGFFDDIDNLTWQRHQNRARKEPIYYQPQTPNLKSSDMAWWLLFNVDPMFTCTNLRRVGGRGDGPKWTCDPHRLVKQPDCLIYSVGSKGIYKFEDGIVSILKANTVDAEESWLPNCEIHVFDPDPKYGRKDDPIKKNIHYHAWGLKSSYETFNRGPFPPEFEFLSIQEIQQRLGHEKRRIDIFKIDCEGCEFKTYQDWLNPDVDIRQVLVETHGIRPDANKFFDRFFDMGFVPFSKEANSHPGAKPAGALFEWGWIRLHPDFLGRNTSLVKNN